MGLYNLLDCASDVSNLANVHKPILFLTNHQRHVQKLGTFILQARMKLEVSEFIWRLHIMDLTRSPKIFNQK